MDTIVDRIKALWMFSTYSGRAEGLLYICSCNSVPQICLSQRQMVSYDPLRLAMACTTNRMEKTMVASRNVAPWYRFL